MMLNTNAGDKQASFNKKKAGFSVERIDNFDLTGPSLAVQDCLPKDKPLLGSFTSHDAFIYQRPRATNHSACSA